MKDLLSIGEVAAEIGISVETIRMWERRYGRPVPVRLPSGHRRYSGDEVRWLRRVSEALALGHRPGRVVPATDQELARLLDADSPLLELDEDLRREVLAAVRTLRGTELVRLLAREWSERGPRAFLHEALPQVLAAVGRAWADGALEVRHEHFLTEVVEEFLCLRCAELPEPEGGPFLLLSTLAGERHSTGLRMVALACRLGGARFQALGTDLPVRQIALAAEELAADAVVLSVSLATGGVETDRRVTELRAMLPAGVPLLVGGRGARGVRRGPRGIEYAEDLGELERWLADLDGRRRSA